MTSFKDYMAGVHASDDMSDDFDGWIEDMRSSDMAGYFQDYLNTLSESDYARVAYELLQSQ